MTRRTWLGLAIAFATVAGVRVEAAGPTYDLARDWSGVDNPNGVWTFGRYTSGLAPAEFDAFDTQGNLNVLLGADSRNKAEYVALQYWKTDSGVDPNVLYNTSEFDINTGIYLYIITFRSMKVTFGPLGGPTVARFTAAFDSSYAIEALFTPTQVGNSSPAAYVYRNGTQIFGPAGAIPASYAGTLSLTAGETLDFVVWGGNGANKTTEVDVFIMAVSEPATLATGGTALMIVGGLSLRRSRQLKVTSAS